MSSRSVFYSLSMLSCLVFWGSAANAQAPPSPTEGIPLPDRSLTTQDDSASLEVNPAGLGFMVGPELSYGFTIASDDYRGVVPDGHAVFLGAGLGGLGLGIGVQWLDQPALGASLKSYRKYTLGSALALVPGLSFGLGLNYFGSRDDIRLNDLMTVDVGLQWRPSPYFGASAIVRDATAAFLRENEALPRRLGAGVAFRGWQGRLVLDMEMYHVEGTEALSLVPRVLVEPVSGVRLFGRSEVVVDGEGDDGTVSHSALSAGLELSLRDLGWQGAALLRSSANGEGFEATSQAHRLWLSQNKQRGLYERRGRWVRIDLDQAFAELETSALLGPTTRSFLSVLEQLDAVAEDPGVAGVVFRIGSTNLGYGQMWELHQQIGRIRDAGKTTIGIVGGTSTREIYLAAAAEEIWLTPYSLYMPTGLSVQFLSYQEVLDNVGIEAEFVRIGDYKSAPEQFVKPSPSDEALEQTTAFVDHIFDELIGMIARRRNLDPIEVRQMFDRIPLLPHEALAEGFIDRVVYTDEAETMLREQYGVSNLERGYQRARTADERWGTRPEIAIVYIDGMIVDGRSSVAPFSGEVVTGSETIAQTLRRLAEDDNVKAVVLRVDSPGGSATGSDVMFRELRRLATKKPVIASMGNVAASGGYYAAAGADEIFATPSTLTGSIGIFAGKFNVARLADAIGINMTPVQRGERAGLYNIMRPWSDDELDAVASSINYLYRVFLNQVASTRPLDADEVDAVGRGRVWTGEAAQQRGLVDRQGGLIDAIRRAEELAGLKPRQAAYNAYPTPARLLMPSGLLASARSKFTGSDEANAAILSRDSVMGMMLKEIEASILIPLLYRPGEVLMLPPQAIVIE
jgi:protease IV